MELRIKLHAASYALEQGHPIDAIAFLQQALKMQPTPYQWSRIMKALRYARKAVFHAART